MGDMTSGVQSICSGLSLIHIWIKLCASKFDCSTSSLAVDNHSSGSSCKRMGSFYHFFIVLPLSKFRQTT